MALNTILVLEFGMLDFFSDGVLFVKFVKDCFLVTH